MWISRYRWESLVQRVERCEKTIRNQRDEMNEKIYDTAKRILWNPKELSDEIEDVEQINNFIEDFLRS